MFNKYTKSRIGLVGLIAGCAATLTPVVQADSKGFAIEEVVVTARKREENLMDTPVSISAFGASELASRQIERISQVADATPNIVFRTNVIGSGGNNSAVVFIRGIGQDDFIPTVEPGVGIYMDDVYIAQSNGAVIDVADIESIQVLRGPQGTLFGRNTIGGAVLINTKKPGEEFGGNVELLGGNFDQRQAKLTLNVPLTDNLFARANYLYRHKDGYIDFPLISGDDGGGSDDTRAGRFALRWLPSDKLTIDATVDYTRFESDGRPSIIGEGIVEAPGSVAFLWNQVVAPVIGAPLYTNQFVLPKSAYTSLATQHERSSSDVWGTNLTVDWDAGPVNVKSIISYREMNSHTPLDQDHSPIDIIDVADQLDSELFSFELQLSGLAFDDRMKWLTGLYYSEDKTANVNAVTPIPFFSIVSGAIVENESLAGFAQATYDFTDQLNMTVGLRYTDEDKTSIIDDSIQYVTRVFDPSVPGGFIFLPPNAFKIVQNGTFDTGATSWDPYINLSHNWNEDFLTYISYSEGFKGGGFVQRIVPTQQVTSFDPEFAKVYEAGFKWEGLDNSLRLTGAVFFTDYTDLQITVQRAIAPVKENGGDAEIKGFELEATYVPTPNWHLSAGVGYLDAEYTDVDENASISEDNELASVPEWQFNASVAYTLPIESLAGSVTTRLDWSYSSEYELLAENSFGSRQDSYELLNFSLAYVHDSEKWELALQGRNITDEYYLSTAGAEINTHGFVDHTPATPEEWSVKFKYNF